MRRRYTLLGAGFGLAIGALLAAASWRQLLTVGQRPSFAPEFMSVVAAPPFGLLLSYPVAAVTGLGTAGFLAWVVLTPTLNWALVGMIVGAIRHMRASNRAYRLKSRPSA
jgi:hypothetical protein